MSAPHSLRPVLCWLLLSVMMPSKMGDYFRQHEPIPRASWLSLSQDYYYQASFRLQWRAMKSLAFDYLTLFLGWRFEPTSLSKSWDRSVPLLIRFQWLHDASYVASCWPHCVWHYAAVHRHVFIDSTHINGDDLADSRRVGESSMPRQAIL